MSDTLPPIDHLVLPVADIAVARGRLSAIGFTVAPEGVHPFGTVNACVYLADGTFLEPLVIGDTDKTKAAVASGNVFVERDAAFRGANGDEELSALVLATGDAIADDIGYRQKGISAGDMLDFSRAFIGADGKSDTASFRLAFAAMPHSPDAFFFACQRVNVPHVDRSALETHANTATRLRAVLVAADDPGIAGAFLDRFLGAAARAPDKTAAANAALPVHTPKDLADKFGIDMPGAGALRLAGIVFEVAKLEDVAICLSKSHIPFHRHAGRVVVAPAPGQGVPFLFEAA